MGAEAQGTFTLHILILLLIANYLTTKRVVTFQIFVNIIIILALFAITMNGALSPQAFERQNWEALKEIMKDWKENGEHKQKIGVGDC